MVRSDSIVTLVLGLGTLISHGFGLALVPAMLPRIAADLGTGYDTLGIVVAVGLIFYAGGALSAGRIADRPSARGLLAVTHGVAALGFLIAAGANAALFLTVATAVLGFVAPVSWSVTLRVASSAVDVSRRSAVMAGAASGAAVGVLINGLLVQTSGTIHSWRWSFVLAATLAAAVAIATLAVIDVGATQAAPRSALRARAALARMVRSPAAQVVVAASLVAGLAGFPFNVFLTATGIDELGLSSWAVASVWWVIGIVGTAAGPLVGRYGDRRSALHALLVGWAAYTMGLAVLVAEWGYVGLVVAAVGYSMMNYPIWGLVGAIASANFSPSTAVRVVAVGLIGASLGGAFGNVSTGAWIEAMGSFRGPVAVMAGVSSALALWLWTVLRAGALERDTSAETL